MRAGVRGPPIFGPINLLYFCMTYFFDLNVLSHVWDISREYYSLSPTNDCVLPIRWNILDGVIYRWTWWRGNSVQTFFLYEFTKYISNIYDIFLIQQFRSECCIQGQFYNDYNVWLRAHTNFTPFNTYSEKSKDAKGEKSERKKVCP